MVNYSFKLYGVIFLICWVAWIVQYTDQFISNSFPNLRPYNKGDLLNNSFSKNSGEKLPGKREGSDKKSSFYKTHRPWNIAVFSDEKHSQFVGVLTMINSVLLTNSEETLQKIHFWIFLGASDMQTFHEYFTCVLRSYSKQAVRFSPFCVSMVLLHRTAHRNQLF